MTGMTGQTWMAGTPRDDWDGCHDSDDWDDQV